MRYEKPTIALLGVSSLGFINANMGQGNENQDLNQKTSGTTEVNAPGNGTHVSGGAYSVDE